MVSERTPESQASCVLTVGMMLARLPLSTAAICRGVPQVLGVARGTFCVTPSLWEVSEKSGRLWSQTVSSSCMTTTSGRGQGLEGKYLVWEMQKALLGEWASETRQGRI